MKLRSAGDGAGEQHGRALAIFRKSQAQALRNEVEQFAQRYWSLPPAKRQAEHARLLSAAEQAPMARLRLEGLREGLIVDAVVVNDDNPASRLASKVQENYALEPQQRALRRHELIDSLRSDPDGSIALVGLLEDFPEEARLAGGLGPQILDQGIKRNYLDLRKAKLFTSLQQAVEHHTGSSGEQRGFYRTPIQIGFVVLGIVFGIVQVVSNQHKAPTLYSPPQLSPINPFQGLHLEIVIHGDGTKSVEAFDQDGNHVAVGEATKRLMGSKELLSSELQKNPNDAAAKKKTAIRRNPDQSAPRIP